MRIRVGTQSWTYTEWNGVFYDSNTPAPRQLAAYAEQFDFVEVDATFYGTPPSSTLARWHQETPADFLFALKMPREITHERGFVDCSELARIFFERMLELGSKLGPILVQLPPAFDASARNRVLTTLAARPDGIDCALELRHRSWFTPETFDACAAIGVTVAAVDSPFLPPAFAHRTLARNATDLSYLRLLGTRDETLPFNCKVMNRDSELATWAAEIRTRAADRTFVTTSNFYEGFSPVSAMTIARALELPIRERKRIEQTSFFQDVS